VACGKIGGTSGITARPAGCVLGGGVRDCRCWAAWRRDVDGHRVILMSTRPSRPGNSPRGSPRWLHRTVTMSRGCGSSTC